MFAPANYSCDTELDELVKAIIDRTAANEKLERRHLAFKQEVSEADKNDPRSPKEQRKDALITELTGSRNFAHTHLIIIDLSKFHDWSNEQRENLFAAAINNMQISWIMSDLDVHQFYSGLFKN